MKAIVTGGAGFIGSHVAEELVAEGHRVLVLDDLSGGFLENLPAAAEVELRSVTADLDELFRAYQPDAVYHLAAYAAEGLSHHVPVFNYDNNLRGTVNTLSAAYRCGAKHFVFTSSIAAYGHPQDERPFDEDTPCHPCDPYGIAKLACEQHVEVFAGYYGRPSYTIFRPHNVFGPRQNIADPYRNVVGIFLAKAISGAALPVFGDGSQTRSFSYITSVAKCIAAAPFVEAARNATFNVGSDEPVSVLELGRTVCDVVGATPEFEFLPPRNEVHAAHSRHDRVRRCFADAFREETEFRTGIELMYKYVSQRPFPPVTPCPSPIEIADRLPKSWGRAAVLTSGPEAIEGPNSGGA
jgi:UDP-glucose 4-epimerase